MMIVATSEILLIIPDMDMVIMAAVAITDLMATLTFMMTYDKTFTGCSNS